MASMAQRTFGTRGRVVAAAVCVALLGALAGVMAATDGSTCGHAHAERELDAGRAHDDRRELMAGHFWWYVARSGGLVAWGTDRGVERVGTLARDTRSSAGA